MCSLLIKLYTEVKDEVVSAPERIRTVLPAVPASSMLTSASSQKCRKWMLVIK